MSNELADLRVAIKHAIDAAHETYQIDHDKLDDTINLLQVSLGYVEEVQQEIGVEYECY